MSLNADTFAINVSQKYNVHLTIKSGKNNITDILTIYIEIQNLSKSVVWINHRVNTFQTFNDPLFPWYLCITNINGIKHKLNSHKYLVSPIDFTKKDYKKINPNEKYCDSLKVNFKELVVINTQNQKIISDYGIYNIQLAYLKQNFLGNLFWSDRNVPDTLQSNTIQVKYEKGL